MTSSTLTPAAKVPSTTHQLQPHISAIALIAREELFPPLGVDPTPDRPVGFASVFLKLKNPTEAQITLTLQSIKIVNLDSGRVELQRHSPRQVALMPLEYATIDLHLTNQTGYAEEGRVKAIASYRVGDHTYTVESVAVDID